MMTHGSKKINLSINNKNILLLVDINDSMDKKLHNLVVRPHGEDIVNDNGMCLIELCEHPSSYVLDVTKI